VSTIKISQLIEKVETCRKESERAIRSMTELRKMHHDEVIYCISNPDASPSHRDELNNEIHMSGSWERNAKSDLVEAEMMLLKGKVEQIEFRLSLHTI